MRTNEQDDGTVIVDGTARELPMLTARINSSAVYWIVPQYPAAEMYLKVGSADGKSWAATVRASCHPVRGRFRAYVHGRHFSGGRYETRYQVVTVDERGARHVDGEGVIRVIDGDIEDCAPDRIVASAMWPDGIVREIAIREGGTGSPTFCAGDAVDGEASHGEIYAHGRASGLFHLVTAEFDANGNPILAVSEDPVNGGHDQFVIDAGGFRRRIECADGGDGTVALVPGRRMV